MWSWISNASTLWSILPERAQEIIRPYVHQIIVGLISALAVGLWAFISLLPLPIIILCIAGAFAVGFAFVNQIKQRKHLSLLQSTLIPTRGVPEPYLPRATHAQLRGSQFCGITIFLPDLVKGTNIIRGKQFERCVIQGPAVINLINNSTRVNFCSLTGSGPEPDSYFLTVPDSQTIYTGIIGLENCVFLYCWFVGIAIIGKQEEMVRISRSFS